MKFRLLSASAVALACSSSAFLAQNPAPRPRSFEIYDAVLDSLYNSQGDKPQIVIVADSLSWREGGIAYAGKFLLGHRSVIGLSTIESFDSATRRSIPFPSNYRYKGAFHVLSSAEFKELLARGDAILKTTASKDLRDMPYWLAFAEKFPKAWGVTVLSQAGFNLDSTEALIYVRHQCGGGCYSSEVILLDRLKRGWKIVERMNAGSNEGLGIGSLRYLGPGAHFVAMLKLQADSSRRAYVDSVRADRAPRRIRGTIRNVQTGLPIPHAQIFVRTSRFPDGVVRRVVADSRGRYVIRDPLLGGTMLEVQCPGPAHRPGATLDAPGTYVFPMMDTVINMGAPTIEPCWAPRRAHVIASGELESRRIDPPPHPSGAEAEIYAAILRKVRADTARFVVQAESDAWCDWSYDCPKLSVAHLITNGEIDPSTVASFSAVRQDTVQFNPLAMTGIGARLFSNGERAYIEREAARGSEFYPDTLHPITFWSMLGQLYGARLIYSFSRIGFNADTDQAISSIRVASKDDETAETFLLRRIDGRWRVSHRHLEDERPSAALLAKQCVPIPTPTRPMPELTQPIGDYDFALISSSTDNRTIPWRMRFLLDSSGKNVFEVLSPSSGDRLKNLEPGTYISAGKRGIQNASGLLQFDGFGYGIVIDAIDGDHLFGRWEHYSFGIPVDRKTGKARPEPAGHFCAVKR